MQRASALSLSLQHVYQERPYMEWKEWKDSKRVTEVYGVGIVWYQRYHESLQLLCIYLSTISLVSLIPHFVQGTIPFEGQVVYDVYEMNNQTVSLTDATGSGVADVAFLLTTGSYKPETIPYIYAYMTLFLLGLVIHPYLYLRYLTNNHPSVSEDPFYEDPFDHDELYLRDEKDWDIQEDAKHNEGMIGIQLVNEIQPVDSITSASMPLSITDRAQQWSCSKYKRNLLSIFVFILILVVYGVCLWVLQSNLYNSFYQQESTSSLSVHIGISLLLSVIQASTDFLWMMVCEGLRKIEQHNNQETSRKWECMRLFILRVFSVNVFYFVRSLILTSENTCSVSLLGIQHTLIIISYVLGDLIADFLWPAVYRCWKKRTTRYTREYQACLELNLAEEYSATAFRHYLLCSGASFMPGLAVLALMGNLIKLKCDQYRISHLCRLRHRVYATYHKFLLVLGFVTVLAFLIGYPKGILMMFINRNTFFTCDLLAY